MNSAHPVPDLRSKSLGSVEKRTAPWGKQTPQLAEVGLLDALTLISISTPGASTWSQGPWLPF